MPTELRFTLGGHGSEVNAVAFAPDGSLLASGSENKKVRLWDPRTGRLVRELTGHAGAVRALAFSPDGTVLACGCHSKRKALPDEIVLWDPHAGSVRQRWTGHGNAVSSLAFSPDGQSLASGSWDQTVRLWDVRSAATRWCARPADVLPIRPWHEEIWSVAFSPDGRTLAGAVSDGTIVLLDAATGKLERTLTEHPECVYAIAFSPDGTMLASASGDRTAKVWDVATGTVRYTLTGFINYLGAVAFAPDGRTLAVGCVGSSHSKKVPALRLHDARTGDLQLALLEQNAFVQSLSFTRDGTLLAGANAIHALVWQLAP